MIPSKSTIRERILSRVEKDAETGCWVYCGAWDKNGSGYMFVGGQWFRVRRVVAWVYGRCELWDETYVTKSCDTPACCNPKHISVLADRSALMSFNQKGRKRTPYITKGRIRCARLLVREGWTYAQVAAEMGVSASTVCRFLNRKKKAKTT